MAEESAPGEQLIEHLNAELECLQALDASLADEARALRALDLEAVLDCARRKERVAERHQLLAEERRARLDAVCPGASNLSAVCAGAEPAVGEAIGALQRRMIPLVQSIAMHRAANAAYAETGRAAIEGALRRVQRAHAGARTTYAADGRVQAGTPRSGVARRA